MQFRTQRGNLLTLVRTQDPVHVRHPLEDKNGGGNGPDVAGDPRLFAATGQAHHHFR